MIWYVVKFRNRKVFYNFCFYQAYFRCQDNVNYTAVLKPNVCEDILVFCRLKPLVLRQYISLTIVDRIYLLEYVYYF